MTTKSFFFQADVSVEDVFLFCSPCTMYVSTLSLLMVHYIQVLNLKQRSLKKPQDRQSCTVTFKTYSGEIK